MTLGLPYLTLIIKLIAAARLKTSVQEVLQPSNSLNQRAIERIMKAEPGGNGGASSSQSPRQACKRPQLMWRQRWRSNRQRSKGWSTGCIRKLLMMPAVCRHWEVWFTSLALGMALTRQLSPRYLHSYSTSVSLGRHQNRLMSRMMTKMTSRRWDTSFHLPGLPLSHLLLSVHWDNVIFKFGGGVEFYVFSLAFKYLISLCTWTFLFSFSFILIFLLYVWCFVLIEVMNSWVEIFNWESSRW